MGNIAGAGRVFRAQVVEVLSARRVVALVPGSNVAAVVGERLAPSVMDAPAQIVGIALAQRRLPGGVLRSRRVVEVVRCSEQRIGAISGDTTRFVQWAP